MNKKCERVHMMFLKRTILKCCTKYVCNIQNQKPQGPFAPRMLTLWCVHTKSEYNFAQVDYKQSQCKDANRYEFALGDANDANWATPKSCLLCKKNFNSSGKFA